MILNYIKKSGATALVTTETLEGALGLSRDKISEFLCDAVIKLELSHTMNIKRQLIVEKMRHTNHSLDVHPMEISSKGIDVKSI